MKTRKGRPPALKHAVRVTLTLDRATVSQARALGEGNLSAGVRKAVAALLKESHSPDPALPLTA